MGSAYRVVDHIVDHLAGFGVEHLFGVDGANIEDLYDAAYFRDDIQAVLAKHEFSAAAMADGYARSTARLGVVMATSGGGSLNLVPGLGESLASRVPVLALVGQPPAALDGLGSFQDTSGANGALDAEQLFRSVARYCRRVTRPADIVTALPEAIAAAQRGGPAVLLLPKDIQQAELSVAGCTPAAAPVRTDADVRPLVPLLRRARGSVTIIAGEQVARDDARVELEGLRAALGATLATVPDAKDVGGPAALGVTGVMGHPGFVEAVRGSAVCLLIGTRLSMTARAGLDDALADRTVSLGSAEPYLPGIRHVHTEDLRNSLRQLASSLSFSPRKPAPAVEPRTLTPPAHHGPGVRYLDAMVALDTALPDGVDVVVDAGNTGAAAIHHLPPRRDGRFVVALGMGGMGYSFGAGIGMAFGRRRRTVVIAGDGSFYMHGMELHTAIQYRLPVTFVLFNNNAHAMCVTREQLFYQDLYSYNRFGPSRLGAGLAAMFPGLAAVDVTTVDGLSGALPGVLAVDGPAVVAVECSADEIPPFAPFLVTRSKESKPDVAASA